MLYIYVAFCLMMAVHAVGADECQICTREVQFPLCGSDGFTYSGTCELGVQNCRSGVPVSVAHDGPCEHSTTRPTNMCSACPYIADFPLCASDGHDYSGMCDLTIQNCRTGTNHVMVNHGHCK